MNAVYILYIVIFFISGMVIGSFLNAVIYRVPRKISLLKGRSFCPSCNNYIAFYDNIPIFSYLILRGRCRNCHSRISFKYPLVELISAVLFSVNYIFFGISLKTLSGILLCSALVAVSFIDIEKRIIPNVIVLPLTVIGLALSIIMDIGKWWMPLAFAAGTFAFMFIINLIYPQGMGMGDVKLSLMIGAFLVKSSIPALFIGFLTGSLFGLGVVIVRKKLRQTIPFGPFISLGSIIALFWGNNILKWYISFF